MRKNLLLYLAAFSLMGVVLLFFYKVSSDLNTYAALTTRHNDIHSDFQYLSGQINNAAILDEDLTKANKKLLSGKLFYTDSASILRTLDKLKLNVRDSVNIRITKELDKDIRRELSWLLKFNLPDSFKLNKSTAHLTAYTKIDSLINQGIARTRFLIDLRKQQWESGNNELRRWTILFTSLSSLLLIFTTVGMFNQKSQLKIKEHELSLVLNRIRDGVVSVNKDWHYTFLNNAALSTHPLGRKETIGKNIWEVHPQMKGTIFWDKYHEAMATKKVVHIDNYYEPMNIWFTVTVYPSDDGLTIFFKDVTENKKAVEALIKTQKEVADYKFALDEASIVALTDQKGIIRYVNDNFCRISKFNREELLGKDHRIVNSGHHPASFFKDLWSTIAQGKIWKGEIKNKAKDGSIYWVDTTIVPFLDEKGKPYQYAAIRSDISVRKHAEELVIKSEKIYKTIASSIPGSAICLLDPDYRYLLIEGDMLDKFGYSTSDLLGNKASDVLNADIFKRVKPYFEKAFRGEYVMYESSAFGYETISRYIPLKDETDKVYAIMTVTLDVTELKVAQQNIALLNKGLEEKIVMRTRQLKNSNEEMEAFCYSVSHDLRSPLRGIVGFSTILEEDYAGKLDAEGKRIIRVIRNSTMKMGNLIDDLLTFSRTGKQNLLKVNVETSAMVSEIIEEHMLMENNQKISWDIKELPGIYADIKTFRQVWINLISNAIKYSANNKHPQIEIGSYQRESHQIFYVRDNGAGFNEEYRNKLFKVFQRLHHASDFEGTGVGLAIVEKIISRHNGKVWAEGKENEGACFYFSLPLYSVKPPVSLPL